MQIDVSIAGLLASGVALWLVGVGVGRLGSRRDRRARQRLEELEATLVEEREARVRYEAEVAKHFDQTSQIFGDLTRQYTALYAHLAEGSRELCRERPPSLAAGFGALPPAWIEGEAPPELGPEASPGSPAASVGADEAAGATGGADADSVPDGHAEPVADAGLGDQSER